MVSMSKAQGAAQAKNYYSKENYYQQNSEVGYFHGGGLEKLGISDGAGVTKEAYDNLLNGFDPSGKRALTKNAGREDRRAGFDVTFSAPKTVSMLIEAAEGRGHDKTGKDLRDAHERAVAAVMKKIQNEFTFTRVKDPETGKMIRVKVDNNGLMWASFQHDTTRVTAAGDIDPQLHTHNFIFNTVAYTDPATGKTRTLTLSNEEIYRQKMYLGQLYRSQLSAELKKLGYDLEVTDPRHGFFELAGFGQEQIDEFSGRSKAIRAKLEEYRLKYPKMNESALLDRINTENKTAKKKVDRKELIKTNTKRLEAVGIDRDFIDQIERTREKNLATRSPLDAAAKAKEVSSHLDKTASFLTENQSVFTREELMREAMKFGLSQGYTESDYGAALATSKEIVQLDKNAFSTREVIAAEKSIIRNIVETNGKMQPADTDERKIQYFIDKNYSNMTAGQRRMFVGILQSRNQFVVVQGDAGTGKTYSMKAIREYIEKIDQKREIIGLSFTGKAAAGLEEDSGLKSQTLHSFLYKENRADAAEKRSRNRLLIVDEAGMAGSQQVAELMSIAKENGDQVVFVGDTKQFAAVSAGNAFSEMQRFGAQTITMSESLRQKTKHAKRLVSAIKDGDVDLSFSILKDQKALIEADDKNKIINQIKDEYIAAEKKPLIIASRNKDKNNLNFIIRRELGREGKTYTVRELADLAGATAHYSKGYEEGMIISIGKVPGFRQGETVEVVGVKDDKTLFVKSKKGGGKERELNVYEYGDQISAFRDSKKHFDVGERIIFTKNVRDKNTGFSCKNGEIDTIKEIRSDGVFVTERGKKFNISDMPFLDYGYAITDYKAQGVTADHVIVFADVKMATRNSFYVQMTRAKYDVKVFTLNVDELKANIGRDQTKRSTLDYINYKQFKSKEKTDGKTTATRKDSAKAGSDRNTIGGDRKRPVRHNKSHDHTGEGKRRCSRDGQQAKQPVKRGGGRVGDKSEKERLADLTEKLRRQSREKDRSGLER